MSTISISHSYRNTRLCF